MNAMPSVAPFATAPPNTAVSSWCLSRGKRVFDFVLCLPVLICALPLLLLLAALVKLTSRGPVFFRQQRLGQDGTPFQLIKFRSMFVGSHKAGPGVTQKGDPRISPCGRLLRKWKLDELPQLFNVIKGDMSLVGPRPDLPEYFAQVSPEHRAVLQLRPGVTGAATLSYRNEEEILAGIPADQLTRTYVTSVMPAKIALDLEYAARATMFSDVRILARTVMAIFL
jgi:lipopolysaccharide/colanic/teichoic acid biosynthesis glycosyltransferase